MKPIQEEKVWSVLQRLEAEDAEDRRTRNRPAGEAMLTLHPDTARLVHIMIQSINAQKMLEIGGSHGYSTVWLAHAARITGGHFTSLEVHP